MAQIKDYSMKKLLREKFFTKYYNNFTIWLDANTIILDAYPISIYVLARV